VIAAIFTTITTLAAVGGWVWSVRTLSGVLERAHEQWRDERRELLTRITHPQMVPVKHTPPPVDPDVRRRLAEQRREYSRIGEVRAPQRDMIGPDEDGDT
jgi:hypothetical protein